MSVRVGFVGPLSGPFSVFGRSELEGARLAKEDLESGLGISVEVVTADTQMDPDIGLREARRLVDDEGVEALVGAVSSSVALEIGSWTSDSGVVYIASGTNADAITGEKFEEYVFRSTPSNSMLATTIGWEMVSRADDWFLIYSDYSWGQNAQQVIADILDENGRSVSGTAPVPLPHGDYGPVIDAAEASGADGIGLVLPGFEFEKALNELRMRGATDDYVIAIHQLEDAVAWGVGKEAVTSIDIAAQQWGPAVDAGQGFKLRVVEEFRSHPFAAHLDGYVGMDQLVRAAVRAGSTDAEKMRLALEGHEVGPHLKAIKGADRMYWRECDHQLVQPTYGVRALQLNEMRDEPYREWLGVTKRYSGRDTVKDCVELGSP